MDGGGWEVVVVPLQPGRVRALPRPRRDRDELDDIADELLGADDERPPGAVDALLVAGGGGLAGWAAFLDGQPWALPVGGVLLVLGAALPVRWGWRRASDARWRRRQEKALGEGLALVLEGAEIRALVAAHERVLAAASSPEVQAGAHAALVEAATALEGRPAADAASRRFVAERAEAVAALADALEDQPAARRDQLLEARREVVAAGGLDALTVLGGLVDEVRSGGHHSA